MLSGRKFLFNGKRRIGFLDSSVEWFAGNHQKFIERSSRFSQLSETEKQQFIQKGRELAAMGTTPNEAVRILSQISGRSPETIRYTFKSFDKKNTDIPLFTRHNEPLHEETKYQIFRSFRHGETAQSLALRYHRTVGSIYRIVGQVRAMRIRQLPMTYIDSPEFDMIRSGNEEEHVCGPMPVAVLLDGTETKAKLHTARPQDGLPPYLARLYDVPLLTSEQELHLFRKMNYLKYKAVVLRDSLNPARPNAQTMQQTEQLYNEAVETKNEIVSANLRLVVSIAKRHVGPLTNLFELISDGNLSLIQAVEKFDYTRGNRFSTYATWAITRNFARSLPDEKRYHERFLLTDSDIFEWTIDERTDVVFEEKKQLERETQINRFLQELDDREQQIIVNRFGLGREVQPQTLRQVGDEMGVTKERIRQIEIRALAKLRKAAEGERLDIPGLK
jgi:RNA polymerase primary sigma factor/RNA polymerase sigma factor